MRRRYPEDLAFERWEARRKKNRLAALLFVFIVLAGLFIAVRDGALSLDVLDNALSSIVERVRAEGQESSGGGNYELDEHGAPVFDFDISATATAVYLNGAQRRQPDPTITFGDSVVITSTPFPTAEGVNHVTATPSSALPPTPEPQRSSGG